VGGCKCDFYSFYFKNVRSRDSSVDITMGYGLGDPSSITGGARFSLLHSVQTESGAHPAFYPIGTGGSFTGGKAAGT
jgi:hypothetical protein